jgi:2-phospho-L-lactate guanylyltransferase
VNWTAIVPLKTAPQRKQRLSQILDLGQRVALSEAMARHVLSVLRSVPTIMDIHMLSPHPPDDPDLKWLPDRGGELNSELESALSTIGSCPVLIVHADLPLLDPADVQCLIDGATMAGCAIAGDRHGRGTNAIALTDPRGFRFHFGADSLREHVIAAGSTYALIDRTGLAVDCDTSDDLDAIRGFGLDLIETICSPGERPVIRMPEPGTL